jgi:hypothetical protein
MNAFTCQSIGISGTTQGFVKREGDHYIARVGVAIMGMTNRPAEELKDANPFDPDFRDNYAEGKGATREEAIEALRGDVKSMAEGLWM